MTGLQHYLTESTKDEKRVDAVMRRMLREVDEQRNARTKATLGAALDAWLRVREVEQNTLTGYGIRPPPRRCGAVGLAATDEYRSITGWTDRTSAAQS